MKRGHFIRCIANSQYPQWDCPTCKKGVFAMAAKALHDQSDGVTEKYERDPEREAGWVERRYCVRGSCSNCPETLLLVGMATEDEYNFYDQETGEHDHEFLEVVYPKYLYPAIALIDIPSHTPKAVRAALEEAAQLYWPSLSSCANAVRKAIECLMTAQGLPAENEEQKFIKLYHRIEAFTKDLPKFAPLLHAVRELGNAASHEVEPNNLDALLLDTLEIVEYVIAEIYEPRANKMEQLAAQVVARVKSR